MLAVLVAVAAAFGAWSLLLPVVPTAVLDAGGAESLAGLSTGVFMLFTVITQIFTPWLLRKFGFRVVMVVSAFLLGGPAFGYMLGMEPGVLLTVSAIRGVGFGALSVAEAAIIAELVPLRLLGRATGTLGLFVGASQMVALPLGLGLVDVVGYNGVFAIGASVGLVALFSAVLIPTIPPSVEEHITPNVVRVPTWHLVLVPALALMFITTAYGAITNFLPAAMRDLDAARGAALGGVMLGLLNLAAMASRYYAGRVTDRTGQPGSVLIPFQVCAALGVFMTAVILVLGLPVWTVAFAVIFYGLGFGAAQNEALTMMFYRLPRSKASQASAIWNISFDSGTGIGSTVYGMMLVGMSFAPMFGIAAGVILVGLAVTLLDRQLGRYRVVEVNNLAVRLKSVQVPRRRRPKS
ncbi:MFS transporter [Corynebacterium riegelii]|uniref:MFS transporter n=1 Tax=Corynebacterium riegelii TaxID=156976 RepID=UPI00254B683D|nr:MFS transporter [Corynebacterium riegelii]MDK7179258.1 MFS transporter [Corynebacterium riegelii]